MKIFACLFFVFLGISLVAQEIDFEDTRHDLGVIRESDGPVYYDFYFMNTGDAPLRIQSVLAGCGCTTSEWPREAVQPGEKACIRLTYHPEGRKERHILKIAEVYTNSKNYGTHKGVHNLYLSGTVVPEDRNVRPQYALSKDTKPAFTPKRPQDDYERILDRMRSEVIANVNDKRTEQWVAALRRGGKWEDIDYACYFRTHWEPVQHLKRVDELVLSYVNPESDYYANDTLFIAISDALQYWCQSAPKCHNWWYNQIAVPQQLGDILVLMDSGTRRLSPDLQQKLFKMMAWPDPRKWTGANKLDIAMHHLQRGCLLKNDSIMRVASEQAFYAVRITRAEGLQTDLSYQQHDNQLYIGAYGTVFAQGVTKVAHWLQGTPYALQGERLALFRDFILTTYLNVFRGRYIDFSVVGRGISRRSQCDGAATAGMLEKLQQLDPGYAEAYEQAKVRFTEQEKSSFRREVANRIYWRSDYALHNRPGYDFSVRTASVRTRKTESGNGENLCGGYLSDGATDIRVNGNEYYEIFPVWDWNKIPGVTVPQVAPVFAVPWGEMGKAVFSGGVSDGRYGVMAYGMKDYGIEARKSWFFFDEEVVCLGAGIKTGSTDQVVTCINQCLLDGEVVFDRGRCPQMNGNEGVRLKPSVTKILHDSVLYVLTPGMNVYLYRGEQEGNWNTINYGEPDAKVSGQVFKLWIGHEKNREDEKYAYLVVPGVTDMRQYDGRAVKIMQNDPELQAVYHEKNDILQLVFYVAGKLDAGKYSVETDVPCVVMLKGISKGEPEIYAADPCQKAKSCTVRFQKAGKKVEKTFSGAELLGVSYNK